MEDGKAEIRALRRKKKQERTVLKKEKYEKKQARIEKYKGFNKPKPVVKKLPPPPVCKALEAFPIGATSFMGLVLNKEHLKEAIVEVHEQVDMKDQLKDIDSNIILDLLKPEVVSEEKWKDYLIHGMSYYGDIVYKTASAMAPNLKAIIEYAEKNTKAAPDMKSKLRFVAKGVTENHEALGAVVLLAAHGGVCNVQKEIGIRLAYAGLAETMKSDCDENNPKNRVLRILYELRELCLEQLYHSAELKGYVPVGARTGPAVNSHNLAGYRLAIADEIGLKVIPDPDTYKNTNAVRYVDDFFKRFYNIEVVVECIYNALNSPPRKLPYNSVLSYLKYNRPLKFGDDAEEFLFHCFDECGNFTRGTVCWLLYKMDVLSLEGKSLDEDLLFPEIDEEKKEQIRNSRDAIVRSMEQSNPLSKSLVPENALKMSFEALKHSCNNNNNNNNNTNNEVEKKQTVFEKDLMAAKELKEGLEEEEMEEPSQSFCVLF